MSVRYPLFIVNATIPLIVQMFPNPRSISVNESKIFSKNYTLGGIVTEHFGSDFSILTCHGRTQGIVGDFDNEAAVEATLFTLTQLYRLDKIETLSLLPALNPLSGGNSLASFNSNNSSVQQLLQGRIDPATLRTLSSTYIYYRYDVYQGFFTKFNWSQDADTSPRNYEYDFEFMVTQTAQNLLADSMFLPTTITQAAITTAIGLAASSAALPNLIRSFTALGQDITNGFSQNPATAGLATGAVAAGVAGQLL